MKPFELIVWLAAALLVLRQALGGLRSSDGLLPPIIIAVSVVLIGLQLFFEGWRKPILFAAAAMLLLAALPLLLNLLRLPSGGLAAKLALVIATMLLAASTASNWLRPSVTYPNPGGAWPVIGVSALPVLGTSPTGDKPTSDELRLPPPLVKLWYPAQTGAAPSLFDARRLAERWSRLGERGSVFDEPAVVEAPPLDLPGGPAPLLFYYPGWPGAPIESAALVRELVSHGYYVATVEYPARQTGMSEARWQALKTELQRSWYYGDEAMYLNMVEISKERVRSRARDASVALDRLALLALDASSSFAGRFDPSKVGIVGFSLGGGVAVQAANRDPRIITAINLDGRMWAEGRAEGANKPMLMINEELPPANPAWLISTDNDLRYNAIEDQIDGAALTANLARHGGMQVIIAGTLHFNFADLCLTSPVRKLAQSGAIDPLRGYEILYAYVLAWFDRSLRGVPSPLLDTTTSPFPEVTARYWPAISAVAPASANDIPKPLSDFLSDEADEHSAETTAR